MPRQKVDAETIKVRQEIAKNLRALSRGMTQAEFAEKVGIPLTTLSGYMTAKSTIKPGNTQKIADAFGLQKSDIDPRFRDKESILNTSKDARKLTSIYVQLTDENKKKVVNYSEHLLKEQEHPNNTVKEVQFVGYSAAGTEPESYCAEPFVEYTVTDKLKADAFVVLTGDSMEPRFHKGEPVFYRSQANIENGEFAIVDIDGEGAICKQIKIDYDNHKIILHSLNPKYEDIIMDPTRIRILGKVIE